MLKVQIRNYPEGNFWLRNIFPKFNLYDMEYNF